MPNWTFGVLKQFPLNAHNKDNTKNKFRECNAHFLKLWLLKILCKVSKCWKYLSNGTFCTLYAGFFISDALNGQKQLQLKEYIQRDFIDEGIKGPL